MATMILYYYEHELIRKIKRKGNLTDHKFGNVLRFIDELAPKIMVENLIGFYMKYRYTP